MWVHRVQVHIQDPRTRDAAIQLGFDQASCSRSLLTWIRVAETRMDFCKLKQLKESPVCKQPWPLDLTA